MSTTLGRYPHILMDSPALDEPYNRLPGVDQTSQFVRSNISVAAASSDLAAITSGTALGVPIYLRKGDVVTNITFLSGATAAGTPTNWWFALYDTADALLAQTADQLTAAWAASTKKTLALSAAQTIATTGWHTVAVSVTASTVPTLAGCAPLVGTAGLFTGSKPMGRTFGSSLGATAPASISSPTTVAKCPIVVVST